MLNLIKDGKEGGKERDRKVPIPIPFSPVTSLNIEISPNITPIFSFNSFATLLSNFKAISTSPNF